RRHTRSKRDWSSDVCSSDLNFHGSMVFTQLRDLVRGVFGVVSDSLTNQHRSFRDGQTRWIKCFNSFNAVSVHELQDFWLGLTVYDCGNRFTGGLDIVKTGAKSTRCTRWHRLESYCGRRNDTQGAFGTHE